MGLYIHASIYVAVILLLVFIDVLSSPGTIWFHWPMLGWGLAVAIHALAVFIFPRHFAVTEKMIEKEMRRDRNNL